MSRNSDWLTPPGGSRSPRRVAKTLLTSFIVGVLSIGMAWAGAGLVPISADKSAEGDNVRGFVGLQAEDGGSEGAAPTRFTAADLAPGQILGGSAKFSLYPRPGAYEEQFPGARWEQDQTKCETLPAPEEDPSYIEKLANGTLEGATHVADFRVRWHENTSCLYMGGYGIGPMNSITSWDDEYGLWVRSVAMSDGNDTVVMTLIDAVYWEAYYNSMCATDPCGFMDLAQQLAAEYGYKPSGGGADGKQPVPGVYGITPESFIFFSTHSHTAMDFIGGWGGVPKWYMQQATDTLKASARAAVDSFEPAVLEAGESILRNRNGERRKHYRSAEDDGLSWFRLIDADDQPRPETCTTPAPTPAPTEGNNGNGGGNGYGNQGKETPAPAPVPTCEPAAPGRAIATVGAYAAHPVTEDEGGGQGDADFPAVFAKRVEDNWGGVGMFLQTGLGNISPRGNKVEMGNGMAAAVPALGAGTQITDTDITVGRRFWTHPVTNIPLGSLGVAGFFDRTFDRAPAAVNIGDSEYPHKKCNSASPVSVRTSVSAAKIGNLWITGGPGELFSNLTNTIEERNANGITLALGLANDGLGYIVQSFETDHVARQGVGFANGPLSEYEDAYSIDHCFGDATLEHTVQLLDSLK